MTKQDTANQVINFLLEGGIDDDIITTIYGPAASGKTCSCIMASIDCIKRGKKVIYMDTEGGFSVERLSQMTKNPKEILKNMLFLSPASFDEQDALFEKLKEKTDNSIGLIVIDTIGSLYRVKLANSSGENIKNLNKSLSTQVNYLSDIARKNKIPILITNQVYANFKDKSKVSLVGGDILKYGSKCLIELQFDNNQRTALLIKHRSIKEGKK